MISILLIGSLRSPPPFRLRRTSPYSGGRINRSMLSCRDMAPWLSIHSPTTKWGKGGGASHQRGMHFRRPQGGCTVFAAKGGIRNGARKRRTSPAFTVSQPIGKPFNGQAKGLLWLTWRSYAGPPQYFITPEGGALRTCPEGEAGPGQNPGSPGPKGPAAASTLTPVRACQPSGIQPLAAHVAQKQKKSPDYSGDFFHWFQASISTVSGRPASSRPR